MNRRVWAKLGRNHAERLRDKTWIVRRKEYFIDFGRSILKPNWQYFNDDFWHVFFGRMRGRGRVV